MPSASRIRLLREAWRLRGVVGAVRFTRTSLPHASIDAKGRGLSTAPEPSTSVPLGGGAAEASKQPRFPGSVLQSVLLDASPPVWSRFSTPRLLRAKALFEALHSTSGDVQLEMRVLEHELLLQHTGIPAAELPPFVTPGTPPSAEFQDWVMCERECLRGIGVVYNARRTKRLGMLVGGNSRRFLTVIDVESGEVLMIHRMAVTLQLPPPAPPADASAAFDASGPTSHASLAEQLQRAVRASDVPDVPCAWSDVPRSWYAQHSMKALADLQSHLSSLRPRYLSEAGHRVYSTLESIARRSGSPLTSISTRDAVLLCDLAKQDPRGLDARGGRKSRKPQTPVAQLEDVLLDGDVVVDSRRLVEMHAILSASPKHFESLVGGRLFAPVQSVALIRSSRDEDAVLMHQRNLEDVAGALLDAPVPSECSVYDLFSEGLRRGAKIPRGDRFDLCHRIAEWMNVSSQWQALSDRAKLELFLKWATIRCVSNFRDPRAPHTRASRQKQAAARVLHALRVLVSERERHDVRGREAAEEQAREQAVAERMARKKSEAMQERALLQLGKGEEVAEEGGETSGSGGGGEEALSEFDGASHEEFLQPLDLLLKQVDVSAILRAIDPKLLTKGVEQSMQLLEKHAYAEGKGGSDGWFVSEAFLFPLGLPGWGSSKLLLKSGRWTREDAQWRMNREEFSEELSREASTLQLRWSEGGGAAPSHPSRKRRGASDDSVTDWRLNRDRFTSTAIAVDASSTTHVDDAFSLGEKVGDSQWVHVHIADPSTVIPSGSPLDTEAFLRTETVYSPGRVSFMIPDVLASGALSLTGSAREYPSLTFSALVGPDGSVRECSVAPSVLERVVRRTYQHVNHQLGEADYEGPHEAANGATPEPFDGEGEILDSLWRVAQQRRDYRLSQGALWLNIPRMMMTWVSDVPEHREREGVAVNGRILPIVEGQQQSASRRLVEEMMILAGEVCAQFCTQRQVPVPFRVQRAPLACSDTLMKELAQGDLRAEFHSLAMLPYMQAATYEASPARHEGVGLPAYSRCTSPIRRYADLLAHRQLMAALDRPHAVASEGHMRVLVRQLQARSEEGKLRKTDEQRFLFLSWLREEWEKRCGGVSRVLGQEEDKWLTKAVVVDCWSERGDAFATVVLPDLMYFRTTVRVGSADRVAVIGPGSELMLHVQKVSPADLFLGLCVEEEEEEDPPPAFGLMG